MPRLRNVHTGAVVSVREDKAARLGRHWVPAETSAVESTTKRPALSRRAPKKSDK